MAGKRTYDEACGMARALDVVGERWALMVVRELMLGPKRFTDLRHGLPAASPDMLSARLRGLEQHGLISKRKLPPPAASQVYELTPAGHALEPVLIELGRWGAVHAPPPKPDQGMSFDAHIMSLRTLFDADLAGDFSARVLLDLGADDHFRAIVDDGHVEVSRGELPDPDATITTDAGTLIAVTHGRRHLADVLDDGELRIDGDEPLATHFLTLFPLPQPLAAAA